MGNALRSILTRLVAYVAVAIAAGLLFLAGATFYELMWPRPVISLCYRYFSGAPAVGPIPDTGTFCAVCRRRPWRPALRDPQFAPKDGQKPKPRWPAWRTRLQLTGRAKPSSAAG
jgi:hypothetical protein